MTCGHVTELFVTFVHVLHVAHINLIEKSPSLSQELFKIELHVALRFLSEDFKGHRNQKGALLIERLWRPNSFSHDIHFARNIAHM